MTKPGDEACSTEARALPGTTIFKRRRHRPTNKLDNDSFVLYLFRVSAADAPSDPLLDRQLQMLGELAEIGMEVARGVGRQASDGPAGGAGCGLTLAFSRVSRAVRMTLMLQSRLAGAARAGDVPFPAAGAADARRAEARRLVERFVRDEHPHDEERVERLMVEAAERLEDEELHGDILDQPMCQIVALICNDLGLSGERVAQALDLFEEPGAGPVRGPGRRGWTGEIDVMWIGDPPRERSAPARDTS